MSDNVRRVRITVRGRVQGVSFRAAAQHEARRLGLTGWVRNEPDGSVLLEAQGPAARVGTLAEWCKEGPPAAVVAMADVEELPAVASEAGFGVRF